MIALSSQVSVSGVKRRMRLTKKNCQYGPAGDLRCRWARVFTR